MPTRTVKDYWPEDPRWGEHSFEPSTAISGADYRDTMRSYVDDSRELVAEFEQKYPNAHWWTPQFVEKYPDIALLMHSVNSKKIFPTFKAIDELTTMIAERTKMGSIEVDPSLGLDAYLATFALSSIQFNKEKVELLDGIMTPEDVIALDGLMLGEKPATLEVVTNEPRTQTAKRLAGLLELDQV